VTDLPAPPRFRIPERLVDGVIAVGLVVAQVAGGLFTAGPPVKTHPLHFLLGLVAAAGLFVRRRWPVEVFALAAATVLLEGLSGLGQHAAPIVLLGVYTVCSQRPRDTGLAAAAVAVVALVAGRLTHGAGLLDSDVISRLVAVAAATAIGLYMGTRRAYFAALRERAEQLARERTLLAERAVDEERVRIARELHDVVAHHVTLLTVQAAAVRETLAADDAARLVLDSMADTGRQALAEMRRMLDLLRPDGGGDADHAPQPGVEAIPMLVEQTRAAGLPVELAVEGVERPVPVGIGLSAYRIVQEALTNVVKHAGPAHARVLLRYQADALELRITDDGLGAAAAAGQGGHGLVGMRERVALFGGELFAGAAPDGGFALRAVLPLDGGAP
jgi:signal transduction histidine kinase